MTDTIQCPTCKGSGVVPDPKAQGKELMRVRKAAGVTLREVASILELSIGYISDLEHGRKPWTQRRVNFYLAAVETAKQERVPPAAPSHLQGIESVKGEGNGQQRLVK